MQMQYDRIIFICQCNFLTLPDNYALSICVVYEFFKRYKKMDPCITPIPDVKDIHNMSGGVLESWPIRLNRAPPRIRSGIVRGLTVKDFDKDNQLWKKRISYYGIVLKSLSSSKTRNIMDMNAGSGGFAAALVKYPVWVMNVVPYDAKQNTLGVLYERGLIGTYVDW